MSDLPPEIQCWVEVEAWLLSEANKYDVVICTLPDGLDGVAHAVRNMLTGLANAAAARAFEKYQEVSDD